MHEIRRFKWFQDIAYSFLFFPNKIDDFLMQFDYIENVKWKFIFSHTYFDSSEFGVLSGSIYFLNAVIFLVSTNFLQIKNTNFDPNRINLWSAIDFKDLCIFFRFAVLWGFGTRCIDRKVVFVCIGWFRPKQVNTITIHCVLCRRVRTLKTMNYTSWK